MSAPKGGPAAVQSQEPADVLVLCSLAQDELEVQWDAQGAQYPVEMVTAATRHWQQLRSEARPGAVLFDGPLCFLRHFSWEGSRLRLSLGRTSYLYALFANAFCQEIVLRWGTEHLPMVLGVSAVVVTGDGALLLMRRSHTVGEFPGLLDVFGGHIDPEVDVLAGVPHPFIAMRNELCEELDLRPADLTSLRCIGLIRSRCNQKPELVFACRVPHDVQQLCRAARGARGAGEFVDLLAVNDDLPTFWQFLETRRLELTPSAYGSLWVYGLHRGFCRSAAAKKS
ncbi:MAG: NUDIX hydrolase [Calditrichaeota bacterium]|nr:NUDIX hydrolase [Calditrichota bacterium]